MDVECQITFIRYFVVLHKYAEIKAKNFFFAHERTTLPYASLSVLSQIMITQARFCSQWAPDTEVYRTRAIIGRSQFEAALVYKPRILGLKNEEFPFLVHKLSVI